MSHVLVVGGTGMLRGVVLHFAGLGHAVTVVARNNKPMERLESKARGMKGRIGPVLVDYRDERTFKQDLTDSISAHGPFCLAVLWIRSDATQARNAVAEVVGLQSAPCDIYQVLGSSAADPTSNADRFSLLFAATPNVTYHSVILGFEIDNGRSRWLTDDEICGGVIHAIETEANEHVVGMVRPWSKRPA